MSGSFTFGFSLFNVVSTGLRRSNFETMAGKVMLVFAGVILAISSFHVRVP